MSLFSWSLLAPMGLGRTEFDRLTRGWDVVREAAAGDEEGASEEEEAAAAAPEATVAADEEADKD